MQPTLLETVPAPGVVQLTLNRPAQRNALDAGLIAALTAAVARHAALASTRVIVIAASGTAFCAGADLAAMRATGCAPHAENVADAGQLAALLLALRDCPKPSIASVQGPAFGGGFGLAAACDLAVASAEARFRLPEVQLGLVPAVISPYVIDAIGPRQARRYFLTGEAIAAPRALELGLVHAVVAADQLAAATLDLAAEIVKGGPLAVGAAKRLIAEVSGCRPDPALAARTAQMLATIRTGAEAQDGIAAALGRHAPPWRA